MTKEVTLLVSVAAIIGVVVLGVGFSTGWIKPEPLTADGRLKKDPNAIVATATLKDAPSLVTRAQEYMALGEYAKAIVFLRAATQLTPGDYGAQKLLAVAAFEEKDMVLAANACAATVRLVPADGDARLGLAKALYALDKLPDAADACRAVLTLPSSSPVQREAARKILEHIPAADRKGPPQATFPIISAG